MSLKLSAEPLIGFIGLGNMGKPMAANLIAKGYRLVVFDTDPAAASSFSETAEIAPTAAAILGRADIVILMLPDGNIVRKVLLGDNTGDPPAAKMRKGAAVVDMSSSAPIGTKELGEALARFGVTLLDAPVSGGVSRAITGTLAIIVGGEPADVDRLRPVFDAIGRSALHVGSLGAGHAMKALNNYVSATGLIAACEAVRVAERFGIDPSRAVEVLNQSTGRNNSTETKLAQFVLSETYASGFTLGLMRKDLATALDLARGIGARVLLAEEVVGLWTRAEGELGKSADHTEIAKLLTSASIEGTEPGSTEPRR
jgi:3-hydroxyisobutyrate dehydrogenase